MKLLLMCFLAIGSYFPIFSEEYISPYTQLTGVYIDRYNDSIDLKFVSLTKYGVNQKFYLQVYIEPDDENVDLMYENVYENIEKEKILLLTIDSFDQDVYVDVLVYNFYYPDDLYEYEFVIDIGKDSYYDDVSKRVYDGESYFYSFVNKKFYYHYLEFLYYKEKDYVNNVNYLDYFRFNVNDLLNLNFTLILKIDNEFYSIDLKYKFDSDYNVLSTTKNYYFNAVSNTINEYKTDKNFQISNLKFPIIDEAIFILKIEGDIEYELSLNISSSIKLLGDCEDSLYCFVEKK